MVSSTPSERLYNYMTPEYGSWWELSSICRNVYRVSGSYRGSFSLEYRIEMIIWNVCPFIKLPSGVIFNQSAETNWGL